MDKAPVDPLSLADYFIVPALVVGFLLVISLTVLYELAKNPRIKRALLIKLRLAKEEKDEEEEEDKSHAAELVETALSPRANSKLVPLPISTAPLQALRADQGIPLELEQYILDSDEEEDGGSLSSVSSSSPAALMDVHLGPDLSVFNRLVESFIQFSKKASNEADSSGKSLNYVLNPTITHPSNVRWKCARCDSTRDYTFNNVVKGHVQDSVLQCNSSLKRYHERVLRDICVDVMPMDQFSAYTNPSITIDRVSVIAEYRNLLDLIKRPIIQLVNLEKELIDYDVMQEYFSFIHPWILERDATWVKRCAHNIEVPGSGRELFQWFNTTKNSIGPGQNDYDFVAASCIETDRNIGNSVATVFIPFFVFTY